MKKFICFSLFILLFSFSTYSEAHLQDITYLNKVNLCLNTTTNSSINDICKRYKLNAEEYERIFNKKYFDNLSVPNFLLITNPKSGTHLIQKVIALLLGKPPLHGTQIRVNLDSWTNQLLNPQAFPFTHVGKKYLDNYEFCLKNNFKIIFIQRDIRDQLISSIRSLIRKDNVHIPFTEKIKDRIAKKAFYVNQPLMDEIRRIKLQGLVIKFEDLIGPKGTGNLELQRSSIIRIAEYLNISLNEQQINYICENLWGNTMSFRKGIIGDWKNYFTEEIKKIFIERGGGDVLIELGYETDYNW
jgi:hypothetical protein